MDGIQQNMPVILQVISAHIEAALMCVVFSMDVCGQLCLHRRVELRMLVEHWQFDSESSAAIVQLEM